MNVLNGMNVDVNTGNIMMGIGASGYMNIALECQSLVPGTDLVLFEVSDGDTVLLWKAFDITLDKEEMPEVLIEIANQDTRGLRAGYYKWNVTTITSPLMASNNKPYAGPDSSVFPMFTGSNRPDFAVEEVGLVV